MALAHPPRDEGAVKTAVKMIMVKGKKNSNGSVWGTLRYQRQGQQQGR